MTSPGFDPGSHQKHTVKCTSLKYYNVHANVLRLICTSKLANCTIVKMNYDNSSCDWSDTTCVNVCYDVTFAMQMSVTLHHGRRRCWLK